MNRRAICIGVVAALGFVSTSARAVTFDALCAAPGVLRCEGFETTPKFSQPSWPSPGLYFSPEDGSHTRASRDTSVMASGASSLKFTIPSGSGSDPSGQWRQDFGHSFQAGETFYVQFRQRFSPEMISVDWKATGGQPTAWKQVIFHTEDSTCGPLELTTVRYLWGDSLPTMYTECGARGLYANGDTLLQQGDYTCVEGSTSPATCFYYQPNVWTTFSYRVHIGAWGVANSEITAWIAVDGQPLKKWVDLKNFVLNRDASPPGLGYDYLTLLPYMTNKDPSAAHPTATTWYDDLIISSQPIGMPNLAPPGANTPPDGTTPPSGGPDGAGSSTDKGGNGATGASTSTSSSAEDADAGCSTGARAPANALATLGLVVTALATLRRRRSVSRHRGAR